MSFSHFSSTFFASSGAPEEWHRSGISVRKPGNPISAWSRSASKRIFDVACVLCALPIALPLILLIALAVRISTRGPVLFRQTRMGRSGQLFTILKFRTMTTQNAEASRPGITTAKNQSFTPLGPFLRRWKLDEFPQLLNVLRGEMSLVGPRPKLPRYETSPLACRPGLTGLATMVFAREEMAMAQVPTAYVETYYKALVQPFKRKLDADYMARASFASDLELILRSLFRRWDDVALTTLPPWIPQMHGTRQQPIAHSSAAPQQGLASSAR